MIHVSLSPSKLYISQKANDARKLLPGVAICMVVAMAAVFISDNYRGPTVLYALALGMALNYLASEGACSAGIQFTAKSVLRFGIALLGARITTDKIFSLGLTPIMIALSVVPLTIAFGYICGRLLRLGTTQSILSGSAVGICGASAALAVSTVLPSGKDSEKELIFTVISVTALSTIAMVTYPMVANMLGFDTTESGIFLGATIHDVAQVVGAGYMMSSDTGDIATFTKLLRVAMLVPVVGILSIVVTRQTEQKREVGTKLPLLPTFLIAFILIITLNSFEIIPSYGVQWMNDLSRWCLIIAMVALGMKASLKELMSVGWRPMLHVTLETLFLAAFVAAWLIISR